MKKHSNLLIKSAIFLSALVFSSIAYGNIEKTLHYSSEASSGDQVYFTGDNASVTIVKGDSNDVVYDVKMVYKRDDKEKAEKTFNKVEWTFTEGSEIRLVEEIKKHKKVKNLEIYVTVTLPDEHPLEIATVNGYIKTEDDFQTNVTVTSVNGDIELGNHIGGSLNALNVNGLVEAGNVAENCYAKSVNGNIRISSVDGELTVESVNGDTCVGETKSSVSISGVNGNTTLSLTEETTGFINMHTVNGDLKIKCPQSLETTITAKTGNGSLSCDKTLKITKIKKNKIEGTSGDGSVKLKLKSVNGNVTIETY